MKRLGGPLYIGGRRCGGKLRVLRLFSDICGRICGSEVGGLNPLGLDMCVLKFRGVVKSALENGSSTGIDSFCLLTILRC